MRNLKWKLINCRPRIYKLHSSLYHTTWSWPHKEHDGHWWADLGRYVFTTSPK